MISGVYHHCRHVAYCPYCVHSVQQLLQVCLQATKYLNNPLTPFLFLLPFPLLPELLSSFLTSPFLFFSSSLLSHLGSSLISFHPFMFFFVSFPLIFGGLWPFYTSLSSSITSLFFISLPHSLLPFSLSSSFSFSLSSSLSLPFFTLLLILPSPQGCSSPIVVKFADTQKDKEQRRLQQQLAQQMQQLNSATTWGSLTGLGGLTPQYLAVRSAVEPPTSITSSTTPYCSPVANTAAVSAPKQEQSNSKKSIQHRPAVFSFFISSFCSVIPFLELPLFLSFILLLGKLRSEEMGSLN